MNASVPKAFNNPNLREATKPISGEEAMSAKTSDMVHKLNVAQTNQSEYLPHLIQPQITNNTSATANVYEHLLVTEVQESVNTNIENAKPLDPQSFPDLPRKQDNQKPCTLGNVKHLIAGYKIIIRYNIISKKENIVIPNLKATPDNTDNISVTIIFSLANLNEMATGQLFNLIGVIADQNQFNPVADWIMDKPWDGENRLNDIYATLVQRDGFPEKLKLALMYRWLLSAVAAVLMPSGFKARGVLTLQGPQSIGKTSWISALVPDAILRETVLKLDHHLDAGNKDSIITALVHWVVEIGELDSSFKKDIARLKGFLTADRDKVRRPYGRVDSDYPRHTVFCATVNEHAFLVDTTGNSRWWSIPVTSVNFQHNINMQQLFAQLAIDFKNGEQWWLSKEEEQLLELHNKEHASVSAIRERILEALDLDRRGEGGLPTYTPTQLLQKLDIKNPTNTQCKECAAVLREHLGESKKIQGQFKWRIPFFKHGWESPLTPKILIKDNSDLY